jgi:hypothetical protein
MAASVYFSLWKIRVLTSPSVMTGRIPCSIRQKTRYLGEMKGIAWEPGNLPGVILPAMLPEDSETLEKISHPAFCPMDKERCASIGFPLRIFFT